ncbi:hypothetical protein P7K49_027067 [Saguinus oedipus]|uniref:Uncharacterized protein n=1 Tax=Saguinus oedipus TaxID=9490 RepID=A0ABQ9UF24_SAGOE|nr:hypothetical protein P7K49_027067 [Saguinus oedipus]
MVRHIYRDLEAADAAALQGNPDPHGSIVGSSLSPPRALLRQAPNPAVEERNTPPVFWEMGGICSLIKECYLLCISRGKVLSPPGGKAEGTWYPRVGSQRNVSLRLNKGRDGKLKCLWEVLTRLKKRLCYCGPNPLDEGSIDGFTITLARGTTELHCFASDKCFSYTP